MIDEINGPALRKALVRRSATKYTYQQYVEHAHVEYKYCDKWGTRFPEYAATHIDITAYYVTMNEALHRALGEILQRLPGVVSVSFHPADVTGRRTTRPLVRARFERQSAMGLLRP